MLTRILRLASCYLAFVILFVLQKPLFMAFHIHLFSDVEWADWLRIMWYGLPLDLSLAGYLTALLSLMLIASVWTQSRVLIYFLKTYSVLVAVLMASIFVVDVGLYEAWQFRLDATPVFYFMSSPADAIASITARQWVMGSMFFCIYVAILYKCLSLIMCRPLPQLRMKQKITSSVVLLLLTGALFIPIRGGFSVSTMNLSRVYFSAVPKLNHAAINPIFSFMYSITHQQNFDEQFRFFPSDEADKHFEGLTQSTILQPDSTLQVLTTNRPNVVFIILESFSTHLMSSFGNVSYTPELDSLTTEGILFTKMYANSFRTDRGLVSIISGYPAPPTTSVMKYADKTEKLPAISASLKEVGYVPTYYYGGDANFTNMQSYLISAGFEKIVSEDDFPRSQRESKWGAYDHALFQRVMSDLRSQTGNQSTATFIQTSSSHEPFEVPFHRHENERLNAFAYTDSCVGAFVRELKTLPTWKNTLVILVPDHWGAYPRPLENGEARHTIPMLWIGGAVKQPMRVDVYSSQIDIAATLLAQMGLPHRNFTFSKNLFHPNVRKFAFFTEGSLFGMITEQGKAIYNLEGNTVQVQEGPQGHQLLMQGKAYLQKLYDHLEGL